MRTRLVTRLRAAFHATTPVSTVIAARQPGIPSGTGLTASWGVLFDHLTVDDIDEFGPFARLGGGAYSPLSVAKPRRSYERTALYANLIHNVSRL